MCKSIVLLVAIVAVSFIIQGCGCGCAKKAGEIVGGGATDFGKGVGGGADESLKIKIELGEGLTARGIKNTVANLIKDSTGKGVSVYLISTDKFEETLVAKAYDKEDKEIGRAKTEVKLGVDDAKYFQFFVEGSTDTMLIEKYVLSILNK